MKTSLTRKKGFTLIEMTVVILFGLAISSVGMLMLNQQVRTSQRLRDQDFILIEAPKINSVMSSLLGQADAIRLHTQFSDALTDSNPVLANATVLVAAFNDVNGNIQFGIISFEDNGGPKRLNYYLLDRGATVLPTEGSPSWTISRNVENASFDLVNGLFEITLTGPQAETLTYTISPNQ